MIVLGIVLVLVAWLAGISFLYTLGIALIVLGVILELLGTAGRPIGPYRHYW